MNPQLVSAVILLLLDGGLLDGLLHARGRPRVTRRRGLRLRRPRVRPLLLQYQQPVQQQPVQTVPYEEPPF